MASWIIHLRIADELLRHLDPVDETAFVFGNMAPDSGVPNEDWSAFYPPTSVSHFKKEKEKKDPLKSTIDVGAFRDRYLNDAKVRGYSLREYSFFLGYYAHLLTDVRWTETVYADLLRSHPEACAADKKKLVRTAKEDWYDLDFLYLEAHPDFHAFSVYEKAESFENKYMDIFSKDAFENRRAYICGFYHSDGHGDLHRKYQYLTPEQADDFVGSTAAWLLPQLIGGNNDLI